MIARMVTWLVIVGAAAPARGQQWAFHPSASAELVFDDAVDLLFEEIQPSQLGTGAGSEGQGNGGSGDQGGSQQSIGFGANVDLSLGIDAHPLPWLSLQLRPEVFSQIFFDQPEAIVVRLSPPLFMQARLTDRARLLFASEYVANLVPNLPRFTFQRETATLRASWSPIDHLQLTPEYVERVKTFPDRPTWDFRTHRVGTGVEVALGAYVTVDAHYAFQINRGAVGLDSSAGATESTGLQHIASAGIRLAFGTQLLELSYQARIARGGDASVIVDQPLLSPSGALEEDTDELSSGGFDKHILELTYDIRLGKRIVADLYGRFSRKSYLQLRSLSDANVLRTDDLWLVGVTTSVLLARSLFFDARALYRINDSNDPTFAFRNVILAVGLRWER